MEEIKLRLNDFLYNGGILGFYRIIENVEKTKLIQIEGNCITVKKEVINNFEDDYIKTMLDTFEEETKWYSIVNNKEVIKQLNTEIEKDKLQKFYTVIKDAVESSSYQSGYESIKQQAQENPYEILKKIEDEIDLKLKQEQLIKIVEHLEKHKEIYCMKDIIYTKINCFWNNLAFLNRASNKKIIKEEYKKTFVVPVQEYLKEAREREYICIECGNKITKTEAKGMAWIQDTGIDIRRKKSGFWDFREDTFLCPVCTLIYSCIPLGFHMIGSNGIFVNNNESFMALKRDNIINNKNERISLEGTYHKIIYNYINYANQIGNEIKTRYEPRNIQVIRRVGNKDKQYYEFNILSKDKLEILRQASGELEYLKNSKLYQEVLTNLLQGTKQYNLISRILRQNEDLRYVRQILNIEAINMKGGNKVEERKDLVRQMIREGEKLQIYFYKNNENKNKLETYKYQLQYAVNANSVVKFMRLFSMLYGSLGKPMPNCEAMNKLMEEPEYFKLLGSAYIYGLGKIVDKREKGENENEE